MFLVDAFSGCKWFACKSSDADHCVPFSLPWISCQIWAEDVWSTPLACSSTSSPLSLSSLENFFSNYLRVALICFLWSEIYPSKKQSKKGRIFRSPSKKSADFRNFARTNLLLIFLFPWANGEKQVDHLKALSWISKTVLSLLTTVLCVPDEGLLETWLKSHCQN